MPRTVLICCTEDWVLTPSFVKYECTTQAEYDYLVDRSVNNPVTAADYTFLVSLESAPKLKGPIDLTGYTHFLHLVLS